MPEHFHLLMTEPEVGTPSTVMQVLKQRTAHALLPKKKRGDPRQRSLFEERPRLPFWQARFYDFNVWTAKKRIEKLRYTHRNPVKRDWLVLQRNGAGAATAFTGSTNPAWFASMKVGEELGLCLGWRESLLAQTSSFPPFRKKRERMGHPPPG